MTGVLIRIRDSHRGASLVVQWLRPPLPMQGVRVRSPVGELGSHVFCGQKTKT